jgi:hypothetical protein
MEVMHHVGEGRCPPSWPVAARYGCRLPARTAIQFSVEIPALARTNVALEIHEPEIDIAMQNSVI